MLKTCGQVSRSESQRRYWDGIAKSYNERYHLSDDNAKLKRKVELLISGARITSDSKVLELGCGTGLVTRQIARTGADVIGIDISPSMLCEARRRRANRNDFYTIGDAHNLHYSDNEFDCVVGAYILQYLDLSLALPEIYRVLKAGGHVAFIDINALNPLAFLKTRVPLVKRLLNISQEAVSFTPWQLRGYFALHGFANIAVCTVARTCAGSLIITAGK